jgi:hypothetical protein
LRLGPARFGAVAAARRGARGGQADVHGMSSKMGQGWAMI